MRGACTECFQYQNFAQDNQLASRTIGTRMAAMDRPGDFRPEKHAYQAPGGRDSVKGLFAQNGANGYEPMDRMSHSQHVFNHHPSAVQERSFHLNQTRSTPIDVKKRNEAQFQYAWVQKGTDHREFTTEAQARYDGSNNRNRTEGFGFRVWDSSDFSSTVVQPGAPAVPKTTTSKHHRGLATTENRIVRRIMTPHVMTEDQREFKTEANASFSHPW
jgi:hypothetical protein